MDGLGVAAIVVGVLALVLWWIYEDLGGGE